MEYLSAAMENITVGLVSGGVVALGSIFRKKYIKYKIEKKYPVRGEYLSRFEDEKDGNIEVVTAPVILKQKGKKILGRTEVPNKGRCWILEGEISSAGHFHGVYYAEDPHDRGIGNFFLYIHYNRHMEGLWSGFDSVNNKITSGRYIFTPVIKNYSIEDVSERDISGIISISDKQLGKDYLSDNDIKNLFNKSDCIIRAAKLPTGEILGFSYSYFASPEIIKDRIRINNLPKSFEYANKIGILKTVAVKAKYKGSGIGNALLADAISQLGKKDVRSLLALGWKSKKGVNIGGLMKINSFIDYGEVKEYWKEDSISQNYSCSVCGEPPCLCSAIIYGRVL